MNDIEKQIKDKEKNINRVTENIKIEEEKVKLQMKNPRPINPQFEFELDKVYIENVVKSLSIEWKRKKEDMLEAIKNTKESVKELKKSLTDIAEEQQSYTG